MDIINTHTFGKVQHPILFLQEGSFPDIDLSHVETLILSDRFDYSSLKIAKDLRSLEVLYATNEVLPHLTTRFINEIAGGLKAIFVTGDYNNAQNDELIKYLRKVGVSLYNEESVVDKTTIEHDGLLYDVRTSIRQWRESLLGLGEMVFSGIDENSLEARPVESDGYLNYNTLIEIGSALSGNVMTEGYRNYAPYVNKLTWLNASTRDVGIDLSLFKNLYTVKVVNHIGEFDCKLIPSAATQLGLKNTKLMNPKTLWSHRSLKRVIVEDELTPSLLESYNGVFDRFNDNAIEVFFSNYLTN